jgi:hypothetical protein
MKNLLILLCLSTLFGCGEPQPATDTSGPYYVAAPDLLYFRNIRQTHYRQLAAAREGVDLYEPRTWVEVQSGPGWKPQLAVNWLEDEAYFFLQLEAFDGAYAEPFTWYWGEEENLDSMVVERFDLESQFTIAQLLKIQLEKGSDFYLLEANGTKRPFLVDGAARTNMLVALQDYFRLLGE